MAYVYTGTVNVYNEWNNGTESLEQMAYRVDDYLNCHLEKNSKNVPLFIVFVEKDKSIDLSDLNGGIIGGSSYNSFYFLSVKGSEEPTTATVYPYSNVNKWHSDYTRTTGSASGQGSTTTTENYTFNYISFPAYQNDNFWRMIDYTFNSDIPILYDYEEIYRYVRTGEWDKEIYAGVDWIIKPQSEKRPNFLISWDYKTSDILSSYATFTPIDGNGVMNVADIIKVDTTNIREYGVTYDKILASTNPELWQQILNTINNVIDGADCGLVMSMTYVTTEKTITSSNCYFLSNQKGHNKGCGLNSGASDDGSTVTFVEYGQQEEDETEEDGQNDNKNGDTSDNIDNDGGYDNCNTLTTTYKVTRDTLNNISNQLWNSSFLDNLSLVNNNPIENIISVKRIPCSLDGVTENVYIGNVDMGITGERISNGYGKKQIGKIAITEKYCSFLDYAPYTKISIFLPYIGYKEIDVNEVMNRILKVYYTVDCITGSCKAILNNGVSNFCSFDGQCGIDIPITASNRAQQELGYVSSALGVVGSAMTGNVGGAISGALSSASNQFHAQTSGVSSPTVSTYEGYSCFIIIDRPMIDTSKRYNQTYGKPLGITKNISSLSGFTVCDSNINLYGINSTDVEKEEIRSILSSGFFA